MGLHLNGKQKFPPRTMVPRMNGLYTRFQDQCLKMISEPLTLRELLTVVRLAQTLRSISTLYHGHDRIHLDRTEKAMKSNDWHAFRLNYFGTAEYDVLDGWVMRRLTMLNRTNEHTVVECQRIRNVFNFLALLLIHPRDTDQLRK